jgi:hypothetical protein
MLDDDINIREGGLQKFGNQFLISLTILTENFTYMWFINSVPA